MTLSIVFTNCPKLHLPIPKKYISKWLRIRAEQDVVPWKKHLHKSRGLRKRARRAITGRKITAAVFPRMGIFWGRHKTPDLVGSERLTG